MLPISFIWIFKIGQSLLGLIILYIIFVLFKEKNFFFKNFWKYTFYDEDSSSFGYLFLFTLTFGISIAKSKRELFLENTS